MKKIILAATGEELEWRDDADGDPCLVRVTDEGVPRRSLPFARIVVAVYGGRSDTRLGWRCLLVDDVRGDDWLSLESIENVLVGRGFIRIEGDETGPQPGRTTQDYLLDEAEAIIKDVVRTASGRACLDSARTLAFIVDLQNYRSSK